MEVTCPCGSSPSATSSSLGAQGESKVRKPNSHDEAADSHFCQDVTDDAALVVLGHV